MSSAPESRTSSGSIEIELRLSPSMNYAMQQNDVPLVDGVTLRNVSTANLQHVLLRLTIDPPVAEPTERAIDLLPAGQAIEVRDIRPALRRDALLQQAEAEAGSVTVEVRAAAETLGRVRVPIRVLAFNEWDATSPFPALAAAFVMPNDPAVARLLESAGKRLALDRPGSSGLTGYQQQDPRAVLQTVAAIYGAIVEEGIGYCVPPASFERTGQKVRTPTQILETRLGTCLDLAFLFAACCEQAGLNPVVFFLREHAFAGAWVVPRKLREAVSSDAAELRKRIDLHEIVAVELTGACSRPPLGFIGALAEARRRLDLDDGFERALDVGMARASGVRPLPLHRPVSDGGEAGTAPDAAMEAVGVTDLPEGWRPPGMDEEPEVPGPGPGEAPSLRLARWKARLLDLTLRNRLLNFKVGKKTIPILCPDPGALEDGLAQRRAFTIQERPAVQGPTDPRDAAAHRQRAGVDALDELLRRELTQKRLRSDLDGEELQARLTEVYRTARLSLEEGGANTLYLAVGFLRWYESDASDRMLRAPLILIPMALDRANVREGFTLRQLDEDARINVTLIKRLEQFGLRIPGLDPLPEDEHGYDVPRILDTVRSAVRERPRWDVTNEVTLCILTFSKFLMWVDLEKNEEVLKRNDIVRHLVDTPFEPFRQGDFPDEAGLDRNYRTTDLFCPVDADASQLAAIAASAKERSFVLQGPPGTGKSQTITNLVSNELALGRTVLFVSEKMAALNVVHTRLTEAGLGPFCLEAHSTKVTKDALRQQLREALELEVHRGEDGWEAKARRLEALRDELNAYVQVLHAPRPCGLSAFDAYATVIGHRSLPHVSLNLGATTAVDRDRLEEMRSAVGRLAHLAQVTQPTASHPLRPVMRRAWVEPLEKETERLATSSLAALAELVSRAAPVNALLSGLPVEQLSRRQLDHEVSLANLLAEGVTVPRLLLEQPGWAEVAERLKRLVQRGRRRDELRADLLTRWTPEFLSLDHTALLREFADARGRAFPSRVLRQWSLTRRLRGFRRDNRRPRLPDVEPDLRKAHDVRTESAALAARACEGAVLLGTMWAAGSADWRRLDAVIDWVTRFRGQLESAPWPGGETRTALEDRWVEIASGDVKALWSLRTDAPALEAALRNAQTSLDELDVLLELDRTLAWGEEDDPGYTARVGGRLEGFLGAMRGLSDWCAYREEGSVTTNLGLGPLIMALDSGLVSPSRVREAFERSFAGWLVEACRREEPVLERFNSATHEARIEDFRDHDVAVRDLTARIVRSRLLARRPLTGAVDGGPRSSETGRLKRFVEGGRATIRKLFLDCRNVLPLYKPCFLMSPLSVAQFLDKEFPPFDLVVFDEASQMPVSEAVGAIARGKRLVVVGDSKQLPPTSFFERRTVDEEFDEDEIEDEESILDECRSAQLTPLTLKWHYRSRHEHLIAFSNQQYYENRLLTFPSAGLRVDGLGVHWREVPDGVYDARQSRTNRKEAEAVVADVVRRLRHPGGRQASLGIVTFSLAQQKLVEDLLDRARADHPEIEGAFTAEREPVFVKNLETVQGDERDVILFSICYGPDATGNVALRFGPLNATGGERRLNVAITRARRELVVFSTLRPEQIDLSRTNALGVAHLKAFLEYAQRGPVALANAPSAPGGACESYFEQSVYDALAARGWDLHKQVGCSGYRIDLAVVDHQNPGRYVLGIECDGANYHSSRTARDRDRLRASVLRGLGWTLHRIWSTDWWRDPQREIEKAESAIRRAQAVAGTAPDQPPPPRDAETRPNRGASTHQGDATAASSDSPARGPYASLWADPRPAAAATPPPPTPSRERRWIQWDDRTASYADDFYDEAANGRVRATIARVVAVEGPVELDRLVRLVAGCWGLQRATDRARARVRELVPRDAVRLVKRGGRHFAWPVATDPASWDVYRVPPDGDARNPYEICPEEAAAAAAEVLDRHIGLEETELLRDVAALFGIQRVGEIVRLRLLEGVRLLEERGGAVRRGTVVERGRPPRRLPA